jgi:hypothetical protein
MKKLIVCSLVWLSASCAPSQKFASGGQAARQAPKKTLDQTPDEQNPAPTPTPPQNVIVKGSFSVWATPSHPAEAEDYVIHIQVKLPSQTMNYYKNDLSGTLVGTDGYVQRINDPMAFAFQRFKYTNGSPTAELSMLISGAKAGVDDTIKVTSKLLQESQEIHVHFD